MCETDDLISSFVTRHGSTILSILLLDRTTGNNLLWADGEYRAHGAGYGAMDQITIDRISGKNAGLIRTRAQKAGAARSQRTRTHAEVFTPSWLCNRMNNDLDRVWFHRDGAFNTENGPSWRTNGSKVAFTEKKKGTGWHAYVASARLELTCGEAPFICSRYDSVTGDVIPVRDRIGFLDRKLRIVSERAASKKNWTKWAFTAAQSTYGYEYQGDNLLIARINMFETLCEAHEDRWGDDFTPSEKQRLATIISWNLWQMDGLTNAVPSNEEGVKIVSTLHSSTSSAPLTLFDLTDTTHGSAALPQNAVTPLSVIYDWKNNRRADFASLGEVGSMSKFYAVIGNPPYQDQSVGDQKTYQKPIYDKFIDGAYQVADHVELIHPARFLFNAGSTPKAWNKKMVSDPHVKVVCYESDSRKFFPSQDIKGGIAITYRDSDRTVGPIGVFMPFGELRTIVEKVGTPPRNRAWRPSQSPELPIA